MRLKGQNKQQSTTRGGNRRSNNNNNHNNDLLDSVSSGRGAAAASVNELMNGGASSCSSTNDDLDNCMDSGDDEIDVGTNADSMGYNSNQPNTSAALSAIQNDHQFGSGSGGGSGSLNMMQHSPTDAGSDHSSQFSAGTYKGGQSSLNEMTEADRKRAHHNALERKRRDHIKDSFHCLRDAIPNIKGEKVATSRAQILKAATDYIRQMRTRNNDYQNDIDLLKKQNGEIEIQIKALEDARRSATELLKGSAGFKQPVTANPTSKLINSSVISTSSPKTTTSSSELTSDTKPPTSNNNVLVLSKPSTTAVLSQTPTTSSTSNAASSTPVNTAASNSKKFKTIINPSKSSLNFINLNTNATNAAAKSSSTLTTIATTANPANKII